MRRCPPNIDCVNTRIIRSQFFKSHQSDYSFTKVTTCGINIDGNYAELERKKPEMCP